MIRLLPREPGNDFVFFGPTLKRGLSTAARCVAHTSCSASSYEPAEAECGESVMRQHPPWGQGPWRVQQPQFGVVRYRL